MVIENRLFLGENIVQHFIHCDKEKTVPDNSSHNYLTLPNSKGAPLYIPNGGVSASDPTSASFHSDKGTPCAAKAAIPYKSPLHNPKVHRASSRFECKSDFSVLLYLLQTFIELVGFFPDDEVDDPPDHQIPQRKNAGEHKNRCDAPFQPTVYKIR